MRVGIGGVALHAGVELRLRARIVVGAVCQQGGQVEVREKASRIVPERGAELGRGAVEVLAAEAEEEAEAVRGARAASRVVVESSRRSDRRISTKAARAEPPTVPAEHRLVVVASVNQAPPLTRVMLSCIIHKTHL